MSEQLLASKKGVRTAGRSDQPVAVTLAAPRVLAVDDDPGMRLLMQETLAKAGFEVCCAASGTEAIEQCREFEPDLVLLDINMPSMDGITACAEIRKQIDCDLPVVMVTSVDDADSIQRAFDAGASDFIVKPINWPLFQRRLDSVLTEWNRTQEFDASNRRVGLLEKVVPEKVMLVSRNGNIVDDLKKAFNEDEIEGQPATLEQLYGAEIARRFRQRISGVLKTGRHNNLEFVFSEHGVAREYEAQFLVEGRDRVIVVVQNASLESRSQNQIYDLAFIDPATGLPNRNLFERSAEECLVEARLKSHSVVFIGFCLQQLGEEQQSDKSVMQFVGHRIRDCATDFSDALKIGKGDDAARIARIDANAFMLALQQNPGPCEVDGVCKQILAHLSGNIVSDTGSIAISPCLGIAAYPADGLSLTALLRAASSAMHEAVQTGERVCFNSQAATNSAVDTRDYGDELRRALEKDQLELYFQPRLSMADGNISCVEALLRWNHPMRGFVDLNEVLNLAKATGLIGPLGDWVLNRACEEAQCWDRHPAPRVSVNLSEQEFSRHDLAERVLETLEQTGLEPHRIDLELTESALLRARNGLDDLETLKALGVGLVLDDFGTGHSSLNSLKQYPIDALKIDASFVRGLPDDEQNAAICEVVITMAHLLGMKAVAEGVETEEQLATLRKLGCDEFQGYHICRPMPAAEIRDYLGEFQKQAR